MKSTQLPYRIPLEAHAQLPAITEAAYKAGLIPANRPRLMLLLALKRLAASVGEPFDVEITESPAKYPERAAYRRAYRFVKRTEWFNIDEFMRAVNVDYAQAVSLLAQYASDWELEPLPDGKFVSAKKVQSR